MDSATIKNLLRGLARESKTSVPDGGIVIHRREVVGADVDANAVESWILRNGGRVVAAPDEILSSGPAQWREPGREAVAYVFSPELLD